MNTKLFYYITQLASDVVDNLPPSAAASAVKFFKIKVNNCYKISTHWKLLLHDCDFDK